MNLDYLIKINANKRKFLYLVIFLLNFFIINYIFLPCNIIYAEDDSNSGSSSGGMKIVDQSIIEKVIGVCMEAINYQIPLSSQEIEIDPSSDALYKDVFDAIKNPKYSAKADDIRLLLMNQILILQGIVYQLETIAQKGEITADGGLKKINEANDKLIQLRNISQELWKKFGEISPRYFTKSEYDRLIASGMIFSLTDRMTRGEDRKPGYRDLSDLFNIELLDIESLASRKDKMKERELSFIEKKLAVIGEGFPHFVLKFKHTESHVQGVMHDVRGFSEGKVNDPGDAILGIPISFVSKKLVEQGVVNSVGNLGNLGINLQHVFFLLGSLDRGYLVKNKKIQSIDAFRASDFAHLQKKMIPSEDIRRLSKEGMAMFPDVSHYFTVDIFGNVLVFFSKIRAPIHMAFVSNGLSPTLNGESNEKFYVPLFPRIGGEEGEKIKLKFQLAQGDNKLSLDFLKSQKVVFWDFEKDRYVDLKEHVILIPMEYLFKVEDKERVVPTDKLVFLDVESFFKSSSEIITMSYLKEKNWGVALSYTGLRKTKLPVPQWQPLGRYYGTIFSRPDSTQIELMIHILSPETGEIYKKTLSMNQMRQKTSRPEILPDNALESLARTKIKLVGDGEKNEGIDISLSPIGMLRFNKDTVPLLEEKIKRFFDEEEGIIPNRIQVVIRKMFLDFFKGTSVNFDINLYVFDTTHPTSDIQIQKLAPKGGKLYCFITHDFITGEIHLMRLFWNNTDSTIIDAKMLRLGNTNEGFLQRAGEISVGVKEFFKTGRPVFKAMSGRLRTTRADIVPLKKTFIPFGLSPFCGDLL